MDIIGVMARVWKSAHPNLSPDCASKLDQGSYCLCVFSFHFTAHYHYYRHGACIQILSICAPGLHAGRVAAVRACVSACATRAATFSKIGAQQALECAGCTL